MALLRELLAAGLDIDSKNARGETGLLRAARRSRLEIFCILAAAGADFDPDWNGLALYSLIANRFRFKRRWRATVLRHLDFRAAEPERIIECADLALQKHRHLFALGLLWRLRSARPDRDTGSHWRHLELPRLDFRVRRHSRIVRAYGALGLLKSLRTRLGEGPLHVTLRAGLNDLARALLEAGAPIHDYPRDGQLPLLVAAESGAESLYPLLWAGEHARTKQTVGHWVFDLGLRTSDERELLEYLEAGGDPGAVVDDYGEPLIYVAFEAENERAAALLLSYGASAEVLDSKGRSALGWAAKYGFLGLVRLLLWRGCDPNYGAEWVLDSPILLAAGLAATTVLEVLLEAGADVNTTSLSGETPLAVAAFHGRLEAIELLLRNGAQIEVIDGEGRTAVHWAVLGQHSAMAVKLIDLGVDPTIKDGRGRNPLDMAMSMGRNEVAAVLREAGVVDRYSASSVWEGDVRENRYDYFISYRHKRFAGAARMLASSLAGHGCSVFFDQEALDLRILQDEDGLVPDEKLKRVVYSGVRSAGCTLFFESTMEGEIDPETGESRTAFSWQLFEQIHSKRLRYLKGLPAEERVIALAAEADRVRQSRGTGETA